MARLGIIGSGNVGANTAFFLAEGGSCDVLLYDVKEGTSEGKALDIMEAAPIRLYRNSLGGTDDIEDLKDFEILFITAGSVRKPDMKREDLFKENAELIKDLAGKVAELSPESVVVIVTEPIDMITTLFVRESGFPRNRVLGLGCNLDSTRFRYLISRELNVSMENVTALAIGRHSDAMIILPEYSNVSGVPLGQLLPRDKIDALMEQTVNAGDLIVNMAQRASAYYAPSSAAAEVIDAIHRNQRRIFSVSHVLEGQYGLSGMALSLPAIIGSQGIVKTLLPSLNKDQEEKLRRSAEDVLSYVEGGAA